MQTNFWLNMWQEGRTGFHREAPQPFLIQYGSACLPTRGRVLVPLCGMAPDMLWLREQGLDVLGVELSPVAVSRFFEAHDLACDRHDTPQGTHYVGDGIEIICGDVFDLAATTLAGCDAIFDRAAMVALPPAMRERYVRDIYGRLPAHCRGLIITLEYPQAEMDGPPFSVDATMLEQYLAADWQIRALDQMDVLAVEPGFRDRLSSMHSGVYQLTAAAA